MIGNTRMIRCTLRTVMAEENVKRSQEGKPALTQTEVAIKTGLPPSVVSGLYGNRVKRVDYGTLDKLCTLFNVQPGALLVWSADEEMSEGQK